MKHRYIAAVALLAAACGGGGSGPTPVVNPPQIACPADLTVKGVTGAAQDVSFDNPTTTGGSAPVNVTCARASGSSFPLGTTSVSCTANDAAGRQASCSFNVVLTGFTMPATRFEAVGDSLTQGENGLPAFVDTPNAYPTKLQTLLDSFYPSQGLTVVNRGVGGERIETTVSSLPGNLNRDRPQAVLVLGGYNNLTLPCGVGRANTTACGDATQEAAVGVRDCIRKAKESPVGVKFIFVSTLTPPGPVDAKAPDKRIDRDAIIETNRKIRQFAASEGATLVDTYALFVGHEADYVSIDGLHLKPAGYDTIAQAFFDAIRKAIPQTPLFNTVR